MNRLLTVINGTLLVAAIAVAAPRTVLVEYLGNTG